jgi:hypothetical protein
VPQSLLDAAEEVIERPFRNAAIDGGKPTLWVRNRHSEGKHGCPLYLQKQTSLNAIGVSALRQKRKSVGIFNVWSAASSA